MPNKTLPTDCNVAEKRINNTISKMTKSRHFFHQFTKIFPPFLPFETETGVAARSFGVQIVFKLVFRVFHLSAFFQYRYNLKI